MKTSLKLKLAKMLARFSTLETAEAVLVYDAEELTAGIEVFVEGEDGYVPAADGEYHTEDGRTIVVADGKVSEIREPEKETSEESTAIVEEEAAEETPAETAAETPAAESEEPSERSEINELAEKTNALEEKVSALEEIIEGILDRLSENGERLEEAVAAFSSQIAKPLDVEFSGRQSAGLTGDAETDKKIQNFLRGCTK